MNARDILKSVDQAGIRLDLGDNGTLRYTGDQAAVAQWLPEIRAHKPELIALLSLAQQPQAANAPLPPPLTLTDREAIQEAIEERAGILEFDAGLPRHVAETQAAEAMRVYRYRLTDRPDWLILIAPGCDLAEARRTLVQTFGAARLVDLAPHQSPMEAAHASR